MNKSETICGIVGFGLYIPKERITAKDLEEKSGIPENIIMNKLGVKQKVLGSKEDHCLTMTIKAVRECLNNTRVNPEEIDLVIFNGEEYKEYICWTAGPKIQKEIGAVNAWSFDISYRCASTPLALKLAKDIMTTNKDINTILIAGGNTISYLVDESDKNSSFLLPLAPGACAIILKRNYKYNNVLETSIITESTFADDVIASHNGTIDPRNPCTNFCDNNMWKLRIPDMERFKKDLRDKSIPGFLKVARAALKNSNIKMEDLDYVAMVHVKKSSYKYILKELGVNETQSIYLDEYGHLGHVDPVLLIKLGIDNQKIKNGSNILLLTGGLGYSFAATMVRWGNT
ncbi:3-oxoacyl-ACP synthase [Maledivibacter halophilus]|uniref:3-oxoacyl-[acyl-carrier-protein] synthase-3 n=1 Tax=Maledivibacter halophilus TaxID=36842 RepID=A0A1T5LKG8_9FIRM|nr:3-oxoacyl-ACP synthase [Maledivibacter halophilus]SKC76374.1 3-oxoacyl-[acyl-carrier-protein] synthase-3 [Maledivibacter halophilus]